MKAATFAAVFVALIASHQVADYWVQTSTQAQRKGLPGWPGRLACLGHVATYAATQTVFLALADWRLGLHLGIAWMAAGLALSAVTHYFADRRTPLRRLADHTASGKFWRMGDGLATGAALLDQAWHWAWLFAAALVIASSA